MDMKYISPFTDFGFKKIFGEEASKPLLIDFLNTLLPPENQIKKLSFKNAEQLGPTEYSRNAVFDIYCQNEKGEKFIIELQKAKQNYFRERTVFYSTYPIREQSRRGKWPFNLKAVFCIGILDFRFEDYECEQERGEVVHTVKLKDQYGNVFYDKLTYIYLEMPNFKKKEKDLETRLDKWLYFIRNLEDLQDIPRIFKGEVLFKKAFETAEFAKLTHTDYDEYQLSLKGDRDRENQNDYARLVGEKKGVKKGIKIGKKEGVILGRQESEVKVQAAERKLAAEKIRADALAQKLEEEKNRAEDIVVAQQEDMGKSIKEKFAGAPRLLEMGMTILQASLFLGIAQEELSDLHSDDAKRDDAKRDDAKRA
jgi:predicted transposase/invertase (TIGR01784 family)